MAYNDDNESNIYGKNFEQKLVNMSSRQQILFLLEKTMKEADWDMDNQEVDSIEIVNENDKFEAMRKKQRNFEIENKTYRYIQLADSLREFIPIKQNKFADRKREIISEKDAYNCACKVQSTKKNKITHPDVAFN